MAEPLYALLYQSNATHRFDEVRLDAILQTALVRNDALNVTGLLLYGTVPSLPSLPGVFVQWLEGRREDVEALYASIREDPRHTEVETLAEGPASEMARADARLFPGFAMAVRRMADVPATLAGFLDYARTDEASAGSRPATTV